MAATESPLKVYEAGKLTVLGFGGKDVFSELNLSCMREEIFGLLDEHDTETLAFDLTGVAFIPSGLLGLLASLHARNLEIHLYNPSNDIVETLEITKLDQLLQVHFVEFDRKS